MFDVLFLHPGGINREGLQGPYFPIGVIGLASLLKKESYNTLIVNLFLKQILNDNRNIEELLEPYGAKIYCVDLHWFVHSFEAIELCRIIDNLFPDSKIVLGGITASLFDIEIMNNFDFIDIIVRGDSEIPLLRYAQHICNNVSGLDTIPNITYRNKYGQVVRSSIVYNITAKELNNFDTLKFDLVEDWEQNFNLINADYVTVKDFKRTADPHEYYNNKIKKSWILYTGRGCNYKCSFCGGSSGVFDNIFRRKLILRSPEVIADEIFFYNNLNIDSLYIPHSPLIINGEYHQQILFNISERLKKLRLHKLKIGFIFEDCPFILNSKIIDEYIDLFNTGNSIIRIYLGGIDASPQKQNNLYAPAEEIIKFIEYLHKKICIMVCCLIGLPGQSRNDILKMGKYLRKLKNMGCVIAIYNAELHPGSELFTKADSYRVKLQLKNFMDYYHYLMKKDNKKMIHGYSVDSNISVEDQRESLERIIYEPSEYEN